MISVCYIRFRFSEDEVDGFKNDSNAVCLKIHYNDYQFMEKLSCEIQQSLAKYFS